MKMNQFLTAAAAAALMAAGTGRMAAAPITPDEALARVLKAPAAAKALTGKARTMELAYASPMPGSDHAAVYVFASPDRGGFILAAADDRAEPLLGFSDDGTFDPDAIPPAMRWWFGEYARQINAATKTAPRSVDRPDREPIAPMVTTRWNQDAPYNALCPAYDGQRSMTGCVATAMAQVMSYHKWPEQGTGDHQYYYRNEWISLDFSKIIYDWGSMIDSYANGAGTERQKLAVAQLMYSCGVSTDMQYTPQQSGTPDVYVASALVDYFGYDKGIRYAERDYFGILDWEDFIYGQLRDYGPVQYSGSSSDGGHSFVCDGYSSDGFFHINWGWGGISDGFFRLTALDPSTQGIGGSSSGYNFNQAVIANIRKPKNGSKVYLNLMMDQGFTVVPTKTTTDTRPGDQLTVGGRILNYSIAAVSGSLGIKFTNNETGEVKYGTGATRFSVQSLGFISSYTSEIPSTLQTGSYTITPVMCGTDGVWKETPVKLSGVQSVVMTIKNGKCSFENSPSGTLGAENVELLTPVYLGNLFKMKARLTNLGDTEFVGSVTPTLAAGSSPIAKADPLAVDLLPGESLEMEYTGIFNHFATSSYPQPGTYTLYLVNESNNVIISEGIAAELHAVPEDTRVKASGFSIVGDPQRIDRNNVAFQGTLECSVGYFGRPLSVVIFPYAEGQVSYVGFFNTGNIFAGAGESVPFTASGVFAAGEPGKRYFAVLFDGDTSVIDPGSEVIFTVADTSGITEAEADDQDAVIRVFTTSGILVAECRGKADDALTRLPAGIYIVETVSASGRSARRIALP